LSEHHRGVAPRRRAFERYLAGALARTGQTSRPLGAAMRYAALSPGKRLRPMLTLMTCDAVGGDWRTALPAAVAIECVHAFSLVHDDLPAMDDDDYRRGRLTTHRKYGEALGILSGDALLAFAFEALTWLIGRGVPPARVVEAVQRLSIASGALRLVGGQALDIAAEGRKVRMKAVRNIHWNKTGGLMGAAMALGAIVGGEESSAVARLEEAGSVLGLAFQIQDDLLNARSSLRRLGKRAGTDRARGKATILKVQSAARTHVMLAELFESACSTIRWTCPRSGVLFALIGDMMDRES